MNAAVGEDAPCWVCPESRTFTTFAEVDEIEEEEDGMQELAPVRDGYETLVDFCDKNCFRYKSVLMSIYRKKLQAEKVDSIWWVKREEGERFINTPRKPGRPHVEKNKYDVL